MGSSMCCGHGAWERALRESLASTPCGEQNGVLCAEGTILLRNSQDSGCLKVTGQAQEGIMVSGGGWDVIGEVEM